MPLELQEGEVMKASSLTEVAEELLAQAENSHSGRAAQTVYGGHDRVLRQTVIALAAGHELAEHESPGEATLQVLTGRVRLTAGDDAWEGTAGGLVAIPPARHALAAVERSVILLTVRLSS
jgi:quercetin dioxygenase-like cupin family protein